MSQLPTYKIKIPKVCIICEEHTPFVVCYDNDSTKLPEFDVFCFGCWLDVDDMYDVARIIWTPTDET